MLLGDYRLVAMLHKEDPLRQVSVGVSSELRLWDGLLCVLELSRTFTLEGIQKCDPIDQSWSHNEMHTG